MYYLPSNRRKCAELDKHLDEVEREWTPSKRG
jgi:hypothetical protein